MRVRNIPEAKEQLKKYVNYVPTPLLYRGQWRRIFENDHPLHIEIGMGKGQFLTTLANQIKTNNYIGIEKIEELVLKALRNLEMKSLDNIKLIHFNAMNLQDIFDEGEIERIYLNFSDPWPKARHEKRRLTHQSFLKEYRRLLVKDGEIHLKTDNLPFFEFSLDQMRTQGFLLREVIYDLYEKDDRELAKTEYEERFISQGKPIYKCISVIK